ncbi:C2H2 and C2HC zinc finger [Hirsutella rhossiliensis]|uniref:C2H2 and C2HC zinc finger n=1 Tax=Hirsutella rhossiliensis TaxID=111463 RepID=A0A9P8N5G6_9HYPO|nr:C2H2 and C2HC zinc finger [Hirsutella rhossiliensis]KAH0967322.1 C2H2 and C2HC zinc finger [Hirsutella rhossiliensis]
MESRPDHRFDPFGPGADAYGDDRPDLGGPDYNDPATLAQLMHPDMPVPTYKSPADVRREAQQRSSSIFASYHRLQAILVRHEATIQRRWAKKKKQQRLEILLSAWPGMAKMHRPDFEAFRKESIQSKHLPTSYKDRFMWAYINQEDLSTPKALLLLLNSRGRYHPSQFAAADGEAMHLGKVTMSLVPIFLNEHVLLLNGVLDAREYGKLLAWDDHPDAFDWMHTRKQFLPGEGLQILEAQERTLAFLVSCCLQILHDIPADALTSNEFSPQPEPQLKSEKETDGLESLAVMAAEAPYRVPAQLDLGRIEALLRAKTSAAEDHLWALREDPGYFAERLLQVREHRQEMLKDVYGDAHPVFSFGRQSVFWTRVVSNMVLDAHLELEVYSNLCQQAQNLQALQAKHAAAISPMQDLPEEFLAALLKFRFYLDWAVKGPLNQLKHSVSASPPMRKFFVREPPVDASSTIIQIRSKSGVKMNKVEAQLTWLLRTLWEDDRQLFLVRLPLALDELERLLMAEPQAKELVSAHVAEVIGNLSILSQCLSQLDLYQPWAQSFESNMVDREDGIKHQFDEQTKSWAKLVKAVSDKNLPRAAKLCDPSDKNFSYPSGKRRTKEDTEAMRRAEQKLDDFWAIVDRVQRTLQRTPEWVAEPAPAAKGRDPNLDVDSIYKPLSTLYIGLTYRPGQAHSPLKTKTKTRGQSSQEYAPTDTGTTATEAAAPDSIAVDARALKVFRTLFFNPAVTSSPGEIPWNDFTYAMTLTGMFAAEKLIQFHEPHPRAKIPFFMARRHGRRLNRAYGWVGETFVLKGKK